MPARVDALPLRAPRSGLALVTAAALPDSTDDRWIDSYAWQPELPDGASASGIACDGVDLRTPGSQPAVREYDPFVVWIAESCSTKGWRTRDYEGRARRALEAQQSAMIAAEFWSGTLTGDTNPHLCSDTATTLTSGAVDVAVGFGQVESALTRVLANRVGMIHVRPEIVGLLIAADLARFDGGFYYSPLGHVIVADAGYTGDGPRPNPGDPVQDADEDSQWVYGTDLIAVRLGSVEVLGSGDPPVMGVDRDTNDLTVWAQRPVGIQWDGHAHVAAEVDQAALA